MESHKEQVRAMLIDKWAAFQYKNELAKQVEHELIFGGGNVHLPIDGIYAIVLEIQNEMATINSMMSGTYVTEPAIYKDNGPDGIATLAFPEVLYVPSTITDLKKHVDPAVLELVMGGQSWKEFVASFKTE
jgi:hypothetical protein